MVILVQKEVPFFPSLEPRLRGMDGNFSTKIISIIP